MPTIVYDLVLLLFVSIVLPTICPSADAQRINQQRQQQQQQPRQQQHDEGHWGDYDDSPLRRGIERPPGTSPSKDGDEEASRRSPWRWFAPAAAAEDGIAAAAAATTPTTREDDPDSNYTYAFPGLNETVEMAALSSMVYAYLNYPNDSSVCDEIRDRNFTGNTRAGYFLRALPDDVACDWYRHDREQGTQVMIVSSVLKRYVGIVFAGTDDWRTSLTDADVLMMPFGDPTFSTNHSASRAIMPDPRVRIHAGFNHAVFQNHLFTNITQQLRNIVRTKFNNRTNPTAPNNRNNTSTDSADARNSSTGSRPVPLPSLLQKWLIPSERASWPSWSWPWPWNRPDDGKDKKKKDGIATNNKPRLFTTGHSLGAANSVITAVAVALYEQAETRHRTDGNGAPSNKKKTRDDDDDGDDYKSRLFDSITSINFGCPRIGNSYWLDFIKNTLPAITTSRRHHRTAGNRSVHPYVNIWRVVNGWDIVPRLPELLEHVGHNVQIHHNVTSNRTTAKAYYQHYGDPALNLSGVPFGWFTEPFVWVPTAIESHFVARYYASLQAIQQQQQQQQEQQTDTNKSGEADGKNNGRDKDKKDHGTSDGWVHHFVTVSEAQDANDQNNDDDDYWNPDTVSSYLVEEALFEKDDFVRNTQNQEQRLIMDHQSEQDQRTED